LPESHGWLESKSFIFISLPSKKRSKENAPEIAAFYPHQSWKSGAKQSTCFAFIPSSSLCFGAAIARGKGDFDLVPQAGFALEKSCSMHMLKDSSTSFGMTREMV